MLSTVAPTLATKPTAVLVELPNRAVLVGTVAGSQLAAVVQCEDSACAAQAEDPADTDVGVLRLSVILSPEFDFQCGYQRVDVLIRIEEVRRNATAVEPVTRYDLHFDFVLVTQRLMQCATLDALWKRIAEQR